MNLLRVKELAGVVTPASEEKNIMLDEATVIPVDVSIEQLLNMLEAAKRGLALTNRLKDPIAKKKNLTAVFVNLNKIRGALGRAIDAMDIPQ